MLLYGANLPHTMLVCAGPLLADQIWKSLKANKLTSKDEETAILEHSTTFHF